MTIFNEALEQPDLSERAAYLDRVCGGDANLRRQVDELLAAHPEIGRFLEPEATSAFIPQRQPQSATDMETGAHIADASGNTFAQTLLADRQ